MALFFFVNLKNHSILFSKDTHEKNSFIITLNDAVAITR